MKPEEIRQMLGGYASGTLSEAEKKLLFEAALEDQVLFDAMADEQALKDLLDDPESRGYLQAVLDEPFSTPHLDDAPLQLLAAPAPAPAPAAPSVMRGRAAEVAIGRAPRRPALWWGLLAAAALAIVSVVGLWRSQHRLERVEIATTNQPQTPASTGFPSPMPEPSSSARQPKPAAPNAAKREADTKVADKVLQAPEAPERARAVPERRTDKQEEAPKPRDESAPSQTSPLAAQTQIPAATPPPPPLVQQPRKEMTQQAAGALANGRVSQDQLQQKTPLPQEIAMQSQLQASARQLYFAPEVTPGAQPTSTASVEVTATAAEVATESSVKDLPSTKKKRGPSSNTVTRGAPAAGIGKAATPAPATVLKAGFAMRYRILRKNGLDFVPVLPGTRFHIGDEVVLVIEKNSGGVAAIDRIANGTASSVPLAIQTNEMARSVPLTVTGPMELALILSRSGAPPGIPQQAASQKTEIADGMVYVAEPAALAGRALVMRVSIPVE